MTGRELARLAAALLVGAAVAFPAGMMLAKRSAPAEARTARGSAVPRRAIYSPKVLSDPYFIEQQRRNIATLEQRCREAGELCAEADAGRRWLDRHAGN